MSVPFTGRGHRPATPGTNFPCSETRLCRISKPSVSKGNQKCFYLLHNTDVLIRAPISSEGKLKSDDMCKTHTLLSVSLSHTQRQSVLRQTVEAEIKKNNCRNNVKNARPRDQVAFLCQEAGWLYGVTLPLKQLHLLSNSLRTLYRDNPDLLCLFVLLHTITWLNDNLLIIQ